jgi:hypothetical protein
MKSDGFITVQLNLPGVAGTGQTNQIFNFVDQSFLRPPMSVIVGMQCFTVNTQALAPDGTPNVTLAIAAKSFLTLYGKKRGTNNPLSEIVQRMPIYNINAIQNASNDPFVREIFEVGDLEIDWQKSFVTVGSAPANLTNLAYVFGFYYKLLQQQ